MEHTTIVQWVTPISCTLFAAAFLAIGALRAELRHARFFGLAYVCATFASSLELLAPQTGMQSFARLAGEQFYIGCAVLTAIGAAAEWRGRVPWRLIGIVGALAATATLLSWSLLGDLGVRFFVNACASAAVLMIAATFIWRGSRSAVSRVLALTYCSAAGSIVANSFVLGVMGGLSEETYVASAFLSLLSATIAIGAIVIALSLFLHFFLKLHEEVRRLADTDGLTGVLNRRAFEARLATFDAGTPICLVVADIDHFKQVNDRHGHAVGDVVISTFAAILSEIAPTDALVARMGGEEFCVVWQGRDGRVARLFAEGARTAFAAAGDKALPGGDVSASFGVARGTTYADAFDRADAALYRAKAGGRDRVECDEAASSHARRSG